MAGEARSSGFTFFTDRGLGSRIVPASLRKAGWMLETMDERYGKDGSQRVADVQWIEDGSSRGDIWRCQDLQLAPNPLEARLTYMSGARVFGLAKADVSGPDMALWLLSNEGRIVDYAKRVTEPFVFAVGPARLRRVQIKYPITGSDL